MFSEIEKIEKRYEELELLMSQPQIVADRSQYNRYAKEIAQYQEIIALYRQFKELGSEITKLEATLKEKHDPEFIRLVEDEIKELKAKSQSRLLRLNQNLKKSDEEDKNIIIEIRAGTGGQEASLFAADLYRMYTKYAQKNGWQVEMLSSHPTELGGFKEIVFGLKGKGAYQHLKWEGGVHRVQRVPTTEVQGRIHTSTSTVAVLIEPEDVDLVIDSKDLRIDTYRSSGPGGQHMQKSDSAVRITHLPSSIVVACQDERSQLKNKIKAMRILRARLLDKRKEEEIRKIRDTRRSQIGSGDRSEKIRTYNFPGRRVTDHRINLTLYRLEAILDGDLDEISDALIRASASQSHE